MNIGMMRHPRLGHDSKIAFDFETFSLFVKDSNDVEGIVHATQWLAASLKGQRKICFWMLLPKEWEECGLTEARGYGSLYTFLGHPCM